MDQAGLEAGLAEGVLHGPVVVAGALDGALHELQDVRIRKRVEDVFRLAASLHQPYCVQRLEPG